MSSDQPGAQEAADQSPATQRPQTQMTASEPPRAKPRAPTQAAFGTSSGAAVMFRDYASI